MTTATTTQRPPPSKATATDSHSRTSETPPRRSSIVNNAPVRTRSLRSGSHVSARAAASRRDSILSPPPKEDDDARAEAAAAIEGLRQSLSKAESEAEQARREATVLQTRLEEAIKEQAKLEERVHEHEEQIEFLINEKREATRRIREIENIYEAERSAMTKEKEEMANQEEKMQAVIQRLKDALAQRNNIDDEGRPPRSGTNTPPMDGNNFAPPSSISRTESKNTSNLLLQKDKLIESLRLELAEAQIKLVESENSGGGRLQELERLLMEARMANARLVEDNESYQLLLQERTLNGEFHKSDFSYMNGLSANQEALDALEGRGPGASLADELSEAAETDENYKKLEAELHSMKEQNKALTLYINKIIERLLQHHEFESILENSNDFTKGELTKDTSNSAGANRMSITNTTSGSVNKPLPPVQQSDEEKKDDSSWAGSVLSRARSITSGGNNKNKPRSRPVSIMQAAQSSVHNDPKTAPTIPIGNSRRNRPMSEQFSGPGGVINIYRGFDGPISPTFGDARRPQTLYMPGGLAGASNGVNNNNNATSSRRPSVGSRTVSTPTTTSTPGLRSETSSVSESSGSILTASPPRSQIEKQATFAGNKPRPLRLVEAAAQENKRGSWISWPGWGKKQESG